ncbi:MAG: globin [Sporichthyaceae bacterium]
MSFEAVPATFFDDVGGEEFFIDLVHHFYRGVAADPELRPLYPDQDLAPAEERFRLFLIQYWGGPTTYSDARGHPRLRMRHAPFAVTERGRDRWLVHMRAALDAMAPDPEHDRRLWHYFTLGADSMINAPS